jgi:hypothetical protein
VSEHNCDYHVHTSLADLHECIERQREVFRMRIAVVVIWALVVIGMWATR